MLITIQILVPPPVDDYHPEQDLRDMLAGVPGKVSRILARSPACLCTAPEDDDIIRNKHGNPVGTVKVHQ